MRLHLDAERIWNDAEKVNIMKKAAVLFAVFVLGACEKSAVVSKEIDACALLSSSDIAGVIGREVLQAEHHDAGLIENEDGAQSFSSTCFWDVAGVAGDGAPNNRREYVILHAMKWSTATDAQSYLASFYGAAQHGVIPNTPAALNIGDDALWWGDGVAVLSGVSSFGISVQIADAGENRRAFEAALARKAVLKISKLR